MKFLYSFFVFICLFLHIVKAQGNDSVIYSKTLADSLYAQKLYNDAAICYKGVLDNNMESLDVLYNLANCYYRLGQLPEAILFYERVLKYDPSNEDAKVNLSLSYLKTTDKYEETNIMFYDKWFNNIKNSLSSNSWATISIILFVFFILMLALFLWGKDIKLKKIGFYFSIIFFIICIVTNVLAFSQKNDAISKEYAIVMIPTLNVKSTPSDNGTNIFVLHEGAKVRITDSTMKNWVEIDFDTKGKGWVPSEAIEAI